MVKSSTVTREYTSLRKESGFAIRSPIRVPFILRLLAAVFVLTTVLDSYTFSFMEKSDNTAQLVGYLLVGFFILFRGLHFRIKGSDVTWFLVFLAGSALEEMFRYASFSSAMAAISLQSYFSYVQVLILYLIMQDLTRDIKVARWVIAAFVSIYIVGAGLTDVGINVFAEELSGRMTLSGINANAFALFLSIIAVGSFCWFLTRWPKPGRRGWMLLTITAMLVPSIARTGSRGGTITFISGLVIAILINFGWRRITAYMLLVPLILGGTMFILLSSKILMKRINASLYHRDYGDRIELADASMALFRQSPMLGVGPAYVLVLGQKTGMRKIATHDTYLQVLLSFGILGAIPFFLGYLLTTLRAWRVRSSPVGAILFTIIAMTFVFGISGHLAYKKEFWLLMALAGNAPTLAMTKQMKKYRRNGRLRRATSALGKDPPQKGVALYPPP